MKLKFSITIKTFALIAFAINMISCSGDNKPKVKLAFMTNATADFWSYGKAGAEKAASEHDDIEIE